MAIIPYSSVYNYANQPIVASALIVPLDNDSFYHPTSTGHTGFAFDGTHYTNGVQDAGPVYASWFLEFNPNPAATSIAVANVSVNGSGLLTVNTVAPHNFVPGNVVLFSNIANAVFLNGALVQLLTASGTQFTALTTFSTHALANDSGTVQPTPYRGEQQIFPASGLILLSPVAMTILDQSSQTLPLWMQFVLGDTNALANNFGSALFHQLDGWTPSGLTYANGIISVVYTPDAGAYSLEAVGPLSGPFTIQSNPNGAGDGPVMIVSIDFSQDTVYLDTATTWP